MTPTDKYTERAREICPFCYKEPSPQPCKYCKDIARALEQAALEARIDEQLQHGKTFGEHSILRIDELRARLAELVEGKRKIVILGYCQYCGRDLETDFCDHCGKENTKR